MAERPTWSCGHPVSPNPNTEEARLHVGHAVQLSRAQAQLRRDLGLRPETRIDHLIFRDGTAWDLQPDGSLKQVRCA